MIEAFDPFVTEVQYLSFASYQGASNEYLYNCISDKTTIDTSNDIQKQPISTSTNDLSRVSLDGMYLFNQNKLINFEYSIFFLNQFCRNVF